MPNVEMFYFAALLFVFPATVIYAGATDLVTMTISNRLTMGLVAAFVVLAVWSGMPLALIGNHVLAGGVALAVGVVFFARGWIGGGDAKLCAATALWIGWDLLFEYVLVSTVLGGLLTLGILMFRATPISMTVLRMDWLARLHYRDTGIPYGISLAAAGLMVYTKSFWFQGAWG
ncbi:Type IV prepilin peptidase TadV/CpaA [hydrothermal vent metagenome]|uniref:Type IV prepilin peptidase TadV/CpaA n=1 Tax=hydrothermal vent metagenome TaxID=652676 RepID=A0A3B0T3D4_9ZZZZ